MALQLGPFGAWFNPAYDDSARTEFVVEAEALGYTTAWLGMGRRDVADLSLVERALDATTAITVATAIVNVWNNDAATVARSYQRIAAKHPERFLLGVGVGHPESIATYQSPLETMAAYLDALDAGVVPRDRRVLAALGNRALRLAAERAAGAHPYLVVPEYTRHAREILGAAPLLAPEHKAVVSTDADQARAIGRNFVKPPTSDYATMSTTCSVTASRLRTSPMVAATVSSMRSCSMARPNASTRDLPRISKPAQTTSASRSWSHPATIPCPAIAPSRGSSPMPARPRPQLDADRESQRQRIAERVRAIPKGFVRTYGDIDHRAPRLVGHVLATIHDLPRHRVVRADGRLPRGTPQRARLLREGVAMRGDRVNLREARLPPDL